VEQQKKVGLQLLQTVFNQSIVPQVIEEHQNFESPYHDSNTNLNNELDSGNDSVEMFVAILAACNEFDALLHGSDTRLGLQVDEAIARMKESTPARFHVDVVEKLEEHIGKYGAERQLARRGGLGENWPPKLHASIDVTSKSEIQAAGAEIAANYGDKSNAAEESHRTSLDQEISNTLKLANELLGLCDENRSVVENAHDEKSAER
jgi:hypothetical protein